MSRFTIGEEVLVRGVRYVVSAIEPGPRGRLRLLATAADGTRFVWAHPDSVDKIRAYTDPVDDTGRLPRRR